jgi:hypothetical protein
MGVERVVHGELAVHIVKVVPADASETVGDRFEADPVGPRSSAAETAQSWADA